VPKTWESLGFGSWEIGRHGRSSVPGARTWEVDGREGSWELGLKGDTCGYRGGLGIRGKRTDVKSTRYRRNDVGSFQLCRIIQAKYLHKACFPLLL
jgi:hypothetical protein